KTVAPSAVQDQRLRQEKLPPGTPGGKARGEVELSSLSTQLHEIEAQLEAGQPFNSARVTEVKRAIAEGRFDMDSEVIAERLIDATREFLRAHKS
ncbi:MAG: flagellar biosynthesis anti-sigma factor FlgM, partial [Burkholderiales bacterium]